MPSLKFNVLTNDPHNGDPQHSFNLRLAQLSITPEIVLSRVDTKAYDQGLHLGHGLAHSDIVPTAIKTVFSIRELKALGGVSDTRFQSGLSDDFVDYPPPMNALNMPSLADCDFDICKLKSKMTLTQLACTQLAYVAFIKGDSNRVVEYEGHINAIHFPLTLTIYAIDHLHISAGAPLKLNNPEDQPVCLLLNKLTMEPQSQLQIASPVSIECQQAHIESLLFTAGKSIDGTDGRAGHSGVKGHDAVQGRMIDARPTPICQGQIQATKGMPGGHGNHGAPGTNSRMADFCLFNIIDMTGPFNITFEDARGGNGGGGGAGGHGGGGGNGLLAQGISTALNDGDGGDGGNGGNGGNGGQAARGTDIIVFNGNQKTPDIRLPHETILQPLFIGGLAGMAGIGGVGGKGMNPGYQGQEGNPGCEGESGKLPTLTFINTHSQL